MHIIKRKHQQAIKDICGKIQEMSSTDNLSIAYITVINKSVPHLHKNTDEIYYIVKGRGFITIGNEKQEIEKDDSISIPKNVFHSIEKSSDEPLELIAITSPKYNPDDVIEKSI